jgi:hypothetical protein
MSSTYFGWCLSYGFSILNLVEGFYRSAFGSATKKAFKKAAMRLF